MFFLKKIPAILSDVGDLMVMVAINELGWDIFTDIVGTYKTATDEKYSDCRYGVLRPGTSSNQ